MLVLNNNLPSINSESPKFLGGLQVKSLKVDGLVADFIFRASNRSQEALILLGGSEGGNSWINHAAQIRQFIDLGYAVLALAYFGVDTLPAVMQAIPLEYFFKAFRWLSSQEGIFPGKYTLVGVSRGAELALLLGSMVPEVKAVVAIAPSSVVFPGSPKITLDALRGQHSAWSIQGQEVAFVPLPYSFTTLLGMISGRRTRMFEEALRNVRGVEAAAIPVEKIQGPVLLESFTRDQIWPSTLMADQVVNRLKANGFQYSFTHHAYETTHSNWSFESCSRNILTFLKEQHSFAGE